MTSNTYTHTEPFEFEAGGSIEGLRLEYHTSDRPYQKDKDQRKVIWICHALTADSNVQAWWPELAGEGKLLDTEKYFVVCVNMIGSCYGSSGPSSINPKTDKPYFFDFPKTTVRDIVRGIDLVRDHLGIRKIDLVIGASIGGFQAIEYSLMFPNLIRKAVFFATGDRVLPYLSGFNESQRLALEADQTFRECKSLKGGKKGLVCARSIAMLSYRTAVGYNITQSEKDDDTVFADRACSYQRYQGGKLSDRFDAYSYYYQSFSVDSENVGRGRGGVEKALKGIKAETTVISIDSDLLFPPSEMEKMAKGIDGAKYYMIKSDFGHDGFLLENKQIKTILEPVVNSL